MQLADAARAGSAASMALGLYLDLAVGTHPSGAETWDGGDLFARGVSLGAPPDAFSAEGQRWGLAPFDPLSLARAGFRPLAETLRKQLQFAHALRIDHILGFDRTFWVPDEPGLPGAYVAMPRDAMLAVVRIEAARAGAVIVGEDLGNIPEGLHEVLDASGVLSCRVVMFEQDVEDGGGFRAAPAYPQAALASFGTHDLPTYAGWRRGSEIALREALGDIDAARADAARTARLREIGALDAAMQGSAAGPSPGPVGAGAAPAAPQEGPDPLHAFLASTPSALVALQIEDVLGLVEQPNLPGTTTEHPNWRRRLPVAAGALATDPRVARAARLMSDAGR